MNNNIEFVYFDIGGVFIDWRPGLEKIAQELDIPIKAVHDLFPQYAQKIDLGIKTWDDFGQALIQEYNLQTKFTKPPLHLFVDAFNIITETHQLAKDLQGKFQLGLLSDVDVKVFKRTFSQGKIPQIPYQAVILSSQVGFVKPQPEIYKYALKKAKVVPEKILFIDDKPDNIEVAKAFGWQGYVFNTDQPQKSVKEIKQLLLSLV